MKCSFCDKQIQIGVIGRPSSEPDGEYPTVELEVVENYIGPGKIACLPSVTQQTECLRLATEYWRSTVGG